MTQPTESMEQEMISANPRKYIVAGLLIIAAFFGGLGAWAAFFPFSGAVIAPGMVKVSMERKTVQHLEGGIVDRIFVRGGDLVEKGQVLVRLKSSRVAASVNLLQGQLWVKTAEFARLKAESRFADTIVWPASLPEAEKAPLLAKILQEENEVFTSRKKDLLGKTQLYMSQIEQFKQKIMGAEEEMAAHGKIIASITEELAAKEALYKDRYIDKAQLLVLRRSLAEREGQAGALRQVIAETGQKIEEFKLRIIDLRNTYQEKAIFELSRVSDQIFEIREKLKPTLDQQERLEIQAPVAGIVINLQIHSEDGGVIRPGDPLMDIVPKNAELIVEARIRTDNITRVQKGQKTKVQLTAFNRRKIPPIEGVVIYISADQLTERTPAGDIPYYVAHIKVNEKDLEESGAYLSPGMPAVCYVTTEMRTILDYLLDPIIENIDQALRESG